MKLLRHLLFAFVFPVAATASHPIWSLPQESEGKLFLADESPIAATDTSIFAVSADHTHILKRPITAGSWVVLQASSDLGYISGLALDSQYLYTTDAISGTIYKTSLMDQRVSLVRPGSPTQHPHEITAGTKYLYVSYGDGSIYRIHKEEGTAELLNTGLETSGSNAHTHLAASGEQLIISNPDDGVLISVSYPVTLQRFLVTQYICRDSPCLSSIATKAPKSLLPDVLPQTDRLNAVRNPGSIATRRGIIYIVDEEKNQVFATSKHMLRPIRLYSDDNPVLRPTRIVATQDSLLVLDDATHEVVVWPLLVPTEVIVDVQTTKSMSALYTYLYDTGILPTTSVPLKGSMEKTLREHRALLSPYVPSLNPVICGLNSKLCAGGKPLTTSLYGTQMVIPDFYAESYIDARQLTLDGRHSLRQEVDKRVQSPELTAWKTDEKLEAMNRDYPTTARPKISSAKKGTFTIPVEIVRYVMALPEADLEQASSPLGGLRRDYLTALTILSLQDIEAKSQQAALELLLVKQDMTSFQQAYEVLKKTINYVHPTGMPRAPYVGVAEADIDCDNSDFEGSVCVNLSEDIRSIPQSVSVASPQNRPQFRDFDITDHGTAVAGIIGAHITQFQGIGLAAPEVSIVPIATADKQMADDIRVAYLNNTYIFNLSLSFDEGQTPRFLAEEINETAKHPYTKALFVVAAPDDGKPDCVETVRYPICWANQDNVIAVAATIIDGTSLLPNDGTSKWGQKLVQVAAPGVGFGATAKHNGYVPVIGTSFAAPLVTATTALLYEQGVTEPRLIKQRIIATATLVPQYKEQIQGGLLNVKRAVSEVAHAVLMDDVGQERVVQLMPGTTVVLVTPETTVTLPLKNLLRLTRIGNDGKYRAVYQDPQDGHLRIQEDVTYDDKRPWVFKCRAVSKAGAMAAATEEKLSEYRDYTGPIIY